MAGTSKDGKQEARLRRRAEALRANLARRKARARALADGGSEHEQAQEEKQERNHDDNGR
ncbi:MAG TPA: hypothetical protein VHL08_00345 [Dongiaceae bacterium]|jgi:hypothetical protein|nr:hypothetical protein [Dongiaceae bacterium]